MNVRHSGHHSSAAELVRSMTRSSRVDSTHVRISLVHVEDCCGVLEAMLDPSVLEQSIMINTAEEARTVEAFACQLMGTSFLALTFSLRPDADQWFPATSALVSVDAGRLGPGGDAQPATLGTARHAVYDTARRSTALDGTFPEEFLIDVPGLDVPAVGDAGTSFREVALDVTGLMAAMGLILSYAHAPVAAPVSSDRPRGVTGPCLRFGVAYARSDDSRRLTFGRKLVGLCCTRGYGLWQRATTGNGAHDYWEEVVPALAPPVASGEPGGRHPMLDGAGSAVAPPWALAVSCVGPVRPGTTQALLQVLKEADAPVLALSVTWLDHIAIIHLLTHARSDCDAIGDTLTDLPADAALRRALGFVGPSREDDRLRDYRALVSCRALRPSDPGLAALWLAWSTPTTSDALELTSKTLRAALDGMAARYGARIPVVPRDGHGNIEYVLCREDLAADRLHGRMWVAVDLDALGVTSDEGSVSGAQLGRFCSDLERLWRKSLSFALRTTRVDLDVMWRESWLGRWASLRSPPHGERR